LGDEGEGAGTLVSRNYGIAEGSRHANVLRPLTREDRDLYERVYTDPAMWAELGGVPEQDMAEKLERDVRSVEEDRHWVFVIVTDEGEAAGTVSVWDHEWNGQTIDEIGWMVLPEFQGRGLASKAVGAVLERARAEGRWPVLHAFPGVTNGPSNAICRKAAFTLVEPLAYEFRGNVLHTNHWVLDRTAE
jgi:RimJ/RimL family protein N-acetyltransferase